MMLKRKCDTYWNIFYLKKNYYWRCYEKICKLEWNYFPIQNNFSSPKEPEINESFIYLFIFFFWGGGRESWSWSLCKSGSGWASLSTQLGCSLKFLLRKSPSLEESRFHHFVARVASLINSLFVAVGPNAGLFTWQIHCTIQAQSGWDCSFPNSVPLLEGLRFWFLNIETFNGYGIQPKFSPGAVIFFDASDYAFGSF